jgi:hypothetical protein
MLPLQRAGRTAVDVDQCALDEIRLAGREIGNQRADFLRPADERGAMRCQPRGDRLFLRERLLAHHAFDVACVALGFDQAWVDGVDAHAPRDADIRHRLGEIEEGGVDGTAYCEVGGTCVRSDAGYVDDAAVCFT